MTDSYNLFVFIYCFGNMFHTILLNIFAVFVAIFIAVNTSLLSPYIENDEIQYNAIQNLMIFTAWALTMRYMVNLERVPFVLVLYSCCILALLMFHTLSNWALFGGSSLNEGEGVFEPFMSIQQVSYVKTFLNWFNTLAFFYIVYLLEPAPVDEL